MASEKQLRANRANGARSRGPKTPEGKARSSQNATRHGLRSKSVLMRNEDPEALQRLLDMYVSRLGPLGTAEMSLVEEMVAASWRHRRSLSLERDTLELEMQNHSGDAIDRLVQSFVAQLPRLQLLHRYQAHSNIAFTRALSALVLLRRPPTGMDGRLSPSAHPAQPGADLKRAVPNEPNFPFVFNKSPQSEPAADPRLHPRNLPLRPSLGPMDRYIVHPSEPLTRGNGPR
ncbi:MAG TPA: hypothetical protein VMS37_30450 [Verrucomicrobiae bacterium]|nr:hypothetical protein [Verrucomicrobiae bacterium]